MISFSLIPTSAAKRGTAASAKSAVSIRGTRNSRNVDLLVKSLSYTIRNQNRQPVFVLARSRPEFVAYRPMRDQLTTAFLRAIPKSDLHLHLDGSLRLSTLIELAKRGKVKLPSYTQEGMRRVVFKESYKDLPE